MSVKSFSVISDTGRPFWTAALLIMMLMWFVGKRGRDWFIIEGKQEGSRRSAWIVRLDGVEVRLWGREEISFIRLLAAAVEDGEA